MKLAIIRIPPRAVWFAAFAIAACACTKDNNNIQVPVVPLPTVATNPTVEDNIMLITTAMAVSDQAKAGMHAQGVADERIGSSEMSKAACGPDLSVKFTVDRSHADSTIYSGSLIANYGSGLSCGSSTMKKGQFTEAFLLAVPNNNALGYSLTEFVSFQNFQNDSLILNGRYVSRTINGAFSVSFQDFTVTYADGDSSTVSGLLDFVNERNDDGDTFAADGSKEVTGALNGINRMGMSFDVQITKALLFNYSCSTTVPVSGSMDLAIGKSEAMVDFGSGLCDKTYTIAISGKLTQSSL